MKYVNEAVKAAAITFLSEAVTALGWFIVGWTICVMYLNGRHNMHITLPMMWPF